MSGPTLPPTVPVDRLVATALFHRAKAERWGLSREEFAAALERSAAQRFRDERPAAPEVARYLEGLHVDDLALAAACALGRDAAWNHFIAEFRPAVLAAARSCASEDVARAVADSIYADLFGVRSRGDLRRSLFEYFHGRSTLGGWLRAVLAQRVVDHVRAARRLEPLDDAIGDAGPSRDDTPPDPGRARRVALVRLALMAALAALAPRDRLRLSLYYRRQMTLAAVGRALGESEATASRKLERTRTGLRLAVERRLREDAKLGEAEIAECFEVACADPLFDMTRALAVPDGAGDG